MKKLFILALALCLVGCGNNETITLDSPIVTVDGIVEDKYEQDYNIWDNLTYSSPLHLIVSVEYPNERTYDLKVSEYVYNYYDIGDTIQFAL